MTKILTHRGLDPSKDNYFLESSLEAFENQLKRGYGLEFDLQFTKDNSIVIIHDSTLERISNGRDKRKISDINESEILAMEFGGCHMTTFKNLLELIEEKQSDESISAIHLKHNSQTTHYLDIILKHLEKIDPNKFIIFDTKIEIAKYLKGKNKNLKIAPSVAHHYDIERYNNATGGTLLSIEEVLKNRELFDWVWLDEWDLADKDNKNKKLYIKEIFSQLRNAGLKISLVSPELHASSPGLLGRECHQDAKTMESLEKRMKEIIDLSPDAICTDYPDVVRELAKEK